MPETLLQVLAVVNPNTLPHSGLPSLSPVISERPTPGRVAAERGKHHNRGSCRQHQEPSKAARGSQTCLRRLEAELLTHANPEQGQRVNSFSSPSAACEDLTSGWHLPLAREPNTSPCDIESPLIWAGTLNCCMGS